MIVGLQINTENMSLFYFSLESVVELIVILTLVLNTFTFI